MMEHILDKLKINLSPKRLKHSEAVSKTAVNLAELYGADVVRARFAGLLHDCAREISNNCLLQIAEASGIEINDIERREPVLLHAAVGAVIACRDYCVNDPEVLRAIAWHTTGGPMMSVLDNVVFLADYIEPGRSFPGVDNLRILVKSDLDSALLAAYDQTIEYLLSRKGLIHPATIEGRNALIVRTSK